MEKIEPFDRRKNLPSVGGKPSRKSRKGEVSHFGSLLRKTGEEKLSTSPLWRLSQEQKLKGDELLEDLLDAVHEAGEELKERSTLTAFHNYRGALAKFLGFTLSKGFAVERQRGVRNPRTMQQKQYTLVRVLDKRLQELVESVLAHQKNKVQIFAKLDEIRGLIVDFTN